MKDLIILLEDTFFRKGFGPGLFYLFDCSNVPLEDTVPALKKMAELASNCTLLGYYDPVKNLLCCEEASFEILYQNINNETYKWNIEDKAWVKTPNTRDLIPLEVSLYHNGRIYSKEKG